MEGAREKERLRTILNPSQIATTAPPATTSATRAEAAQQKIDKRHETSSRVYFRLREK